MQMSVSDAMRIVEQRLSVPTGYSTLAVASDVLLSEVRRLNTIVDRLPKYADCAIAWHGEQAWHPSEDTPAIVDASTYFAGNSIWGANINECYPTREAAEAAREEKTE